MPTTKKTGTKKTNTTKSKIAKEAISANVENTSPAKAAKAAQEILASVDATIKDETPGMEINTVPQGEEAKERAQADYVPGTRKKNPMDLPDRVFDRRSGLDRPVTRKDEYYYIWIPEEKITILRSWQFRLCLYDGGSQSGLAESGFLGTDMYERTLDGKVRFGDAYLMYCPIRLYQAYDRESKEKLDSWNNVHVNKFANIGYKHGIRTFIEKDGQLIYN